MKVEILDNTKKKKIMNMLNENYGINEIKGLFIKTGKEKIRMFSGQISWSELNELAKNVHIELVGMQFCTLVSSESDGVRINFDAINLPAVKEQIKANIIKISDEQLAEWVSGKDINFDDDKLKEFEGEFVVIKHNSDFLGIGKIRKNYIQNYVPKERRTR